MVLEIFSVLISYTDEHSNERQINDDQIVQTIKKD